MSISKKAILLSLAMVFSMLSINAQKVSVEEKAKQEAEGLIAALSLDSEMATKIHEAILKAETEKKAIFKEYRLKKKAGEEIDVEEKKARTKAANKGKITAINEILGKELAAEYRAYRKKLREERMKEKEGGN